MTVGATALPKLVTPSPSDVGLCDSVYIDEIGDTSVVVFKQNSKESNVATILIRGSTNNMMDDIERAIDDGVNNFKAITRDGRRCLELELQRLSLHIRSLTWQLSVQVWSSMLS